MAVHLQKEIEKLKKLILSLGAKVEANLRDAVISVQDSDWDLAHKVIERDDEIDQLEVDVEEEGLKILALHQPVAIDLRYIMAVLKINNDLERIGDLASNIAERALSLSAYADFPFRLDFTEIAELAKTMLRQSLDSLVDFDAVKASQVRLLDDEADAINRRMFTEIQEEIKRHPEQVEPLIHLLSTSRHLERIADLATNISEDIVYMIKGEIIRHKNTSHTNPDALN